MNVNQKGVKGLLKVMVDLQEKGYYTFTAFDDFSPVDLIAMNDAGRLFRLQIKYRSKENRKNKIRYELRTSSVVNGRRVENNKNVIDGWAVYLAEEDKVIYLHKSIVADSKCFIIDPNKNYGQMAEWSNALVY